MSAKPATKLPSFTDEQIREFLRRESEDFCDALAGDPELARREIQKRIKNLVITPKNTPEGSVLEIKGDVQLLDANTLVTTPNSDVIYAMSYVDLGRNGPLVMEAPPMLQGILLDYWQRPIPVDGGKFSGDVGLAGPDGGKGGKFLLLPPGYTGSVPEGCFVYRAGTNNVFIFLRGFYQDPKNLTPAVAQLEQTRIYPLGGAATAKPMKFPDASGVPVNMLPISDGSVFDQLKQLVDGESAHLADPGWPKAS